MKPLGMDSHRTETGTPLAAAWSVVIDATPTHSPNSIVLVKHLSCLGLTNLVCALPLLVRLIPRIAINN